MSSNISHAWMSISCVLCVSHDCHLTFNEVLINYMNSLMTSLLVNINNVFIHKQLMLLKFTGSYYTLRISYKIHWTTVKNREGESSMVVSAKLQHHIISFCLSRQKVGVTKTRRDGIQCYSLYT